MSNFDDLSGVALIVKITSKALTIGPYTDQQQRLFDRVSALREREGMTFDAIAKLLTRSGARSARGCLLAAEHVFSIYKKGKLRAERLASVAEVDLALIGFVSKGQVILSIASIGWRVITSRVFAKRQLGPHDL